MKRSAAPSVMAARKAQKTDVKQTAKSTSPAASSSSTTAKQDADTAVYTVLHCKMSNKKHKTYDDGA